MEKYHYSSTERNLLENMEMPFAIYQFIDHRVVTLILSNGFLKLFGYEDRNAAYYDMDNNMYKDTHPDDVARIADQAVRFATEEEPYEVIYRSQDRRHGGYRVIHAMGEHTYTDSGVRLAHIWYTDEGKYNEGALMNGMDFMTPLSTALHKESLLENYHYDILTGLPNMTYFFELASAGRDAMLERGQDPVLLFIDFSGMKYYNENQGFQEGDRLLRAAADVLVKHFSNENCSRLGQDHFAAFTEEAGLEEKLESIISEATKLNNQKSLPIRIGITRYRTDPVDVSGACDRAKIACDSIRATYASGFAYYDNTLRDEAETGRYIITNLDKALENRWIKVYYQPIVRAVNGKVCEEEALARWKDPERGLLSPAVFIPILEEAGLIYQVDLYVLEEALRKLQYLEKRGIPVVPQSINLSRSDFDACDIVEEIRKRVDGAGISRNMITIEITESIIGSDPGFIKSQIVKFRELGFPVWMDDFGSGYSSLEVLEQFPFDLIKLDMGFIRRVSEDEASRVIITQLVRMINAVGIDTVCEGVETEAQVAFLREIGCSKLQGYYYSRPIPLDEILERSKDGFRIGLEDARESAYYDALGRFNLHDLAVLGEKDAGGLKNISDTVPMAIMEVKDGTICYSRSNKAYRDLILKHYGFDIGDGKADVSIYLSTAFNQAVSQITETNSRSFFDEELPDGYRIYSFLRYIGTNPVTGKKAVAEVILSTLNYEEGTTYEEIARALAADYYNIFYVNIENDDYIEYSSLVGREEIAEEYHGTNFFSKAREDAAKRIHPADRDRVIGDLTKETIMKEIDQNGSFTRTYRLLDAAEPFYVNMKILRLRPDANHIIIGISNVDSQMKQQAAFERIRNEQIAYARIAALSGNYIVLYTIDPVTDRYFEYSTTSDFDSLGISKEGDHFFADAAENAKTHIYSEDLPMHMETFSKENILAGIRNNGIFSMDYRLMIKGEPVPVSLRAAIVEEEGKERMILGIVRKEIIDFENEEPVYYAAF